MCAAPTPQMTEADQIKTVHALYIMEIILLSQWKHLFLKYILVYKYIIFCLWLLWVLKISILFQFKDFLVQYNKLSELCFNDCIHDFTSRNLRPSEVYLLISIVFFLLRCLWDHHVMCMKFFRKCKCLKLIVEYEKFYNFDTIQQLTLVITVI